MLCLHKLSFYLAFSFDLISNPEYLMIDSHGYADELLLLLNTCSTSVRHRFSVNNYISNLSIDSFNMHADCSTVTKCKSFIVTVPH